MRQNFTASLLILLITAGGPDNLSLSAWAETVDSENRTNQVQSNIDFLNADNIIFSDEVEQGVSVDIIPNPEAYEAGEPLTLAAAAGLIAAGVFIYNTADWLEKNPARISRLFSYGGQLWRAAKEGDAAAAARIGAQAGRDLVDVAADAIKDQIDDAVKSSAAAGASPAHQFYAQTTRGAGTLLEGIPWAINEGIPTLLGTSPEVMTERSIGPVNTSGSPNSTARNQAYEQMRVSWNGFRNQTTSAPGWRPSYQNTTPPAGQQFYGQSRIDPRLQNDPTLGAFSTGSVSGELVSNSEFATSGNWQYAGTADPSELCVANVGTVIAPIDSRDGRFAVVHTRPNLGVDGHTANLIQSIDVASPTLVDFSAKLNFLTMEFPEWTGSRFDDNYSIVITGPAGTLVISPIAGSLNSDAFTPVAGIPSSILADLGDQTGGQTGWMTRSQQMFLSAGRYSIYLVASDVADGLVDSALLVDRISLRPRLGLGR